MDIKPREGWSHRGGEKADEEWNAPFTRTQQGWFYTTPKQHAQLYLDQAPDGKWYYSTYDPEFNAEFIPMEGEDIEQIMIVAETLWRMR